MDCSGGKTIYPVAKAKAGIEKKSDPGSTRQQDEIKAIETSAGVKFIDNSPPKK